MTSLAELSRCINLLEEKIDGLIRNFDMTINSQVTTTQLEVASAKIIADIIKELSEKINSCPCSKDIIDAIKNISTTSTSVDRKNLKGLHRPPPPSVSKTKTSEKKDLTLAKLGDKFS